MKRFSVALVVGGVLHAAVAAAQPAALPSVTVQAAAAAGQMAYEGQVEAVRQTTLAAQVPGAVVDMAVKAGQSVQAGQVLLRLDARAAEQASAAGQAQREAVASDLQRKRQLYAKQYISKAALEQAESAYKAAAAQAAAAQAASGFHTIRAPYAGVVASLAVEQGDMAMPGRPLLVLYDPAALRVTAAVPASALAQMDVQKAQLELSTTTPGALLAPVQVEVLPTVDARSMTQQVRATLPAGTGAAPGLFARLWLPQAASGNVAGGALASHVRVPLKAIVRRAEMTGLYVLNKDNQPLLRQVRLGRASGDAVEILSGLQAGERVVTDPQAAARIQ